MNDGTGPEAVRELAIPRPGPCVSIYLTNPGGRETRYDASAELLEMHAERQSGDEELLERAAIETLASGGDVEVADPAALGGAPLGALLQS